MEKEKNQTTQEFKTAREIALRIARSIDFTEDRNDIVDSIEEALEQKYKEGTEDGYDSAMYQQAQQREPWPAKCEFSNLSGLSNYLKKRIETLKSDDFSQEHIAGYSLARWNILEYLSQHAAPTVVVPPLDEIFKASWWLNPALDYAENPITGNESYSITKANSSYSISWKDLNKLQKAIARLRVYQHKQSTQTIPADEYAELTRLRDELKNGEKVNVSAEDPREGE